MEMVDLNHSETTAWSEYGYKKGIWDSPGAFIHVSEPLELRPLCPWDGVERAPNCRKNKLRIKNKNKIPVPRFIE
jgi:hypothetical protein